MPKQRHSSYASADSINGLDATENITNQLYRYPDRCRRLFRKKVHRRIWKDRRINNLHPNKTNGANRGANSNVNDNDNIRIKNILGKDFEHWSDNISYSVSYSYETPRIDNQNMRKKYLGKYYTPKKSNTRFGRVNSRQEKGKEIPPWCRYSGRPTSYHRQGKPNID
jgi:hypothetical protein